MHSINAAHATRPVRPVRGVRPLRPVLPGIHRPAAPDHAQQGQKQRAERIELQMQRLAAKGKTAVPLPAGPVKSGQHEPGGGQQAGGTH